MKQFNVYKSATGDVRAVKIGWSWPGVLFGIFWTLYCRLWAVSGIIFATCIGVSILQGVIEASNPYSQDLKTFSGLIGVIFSVGLMVIIGKYGNSWLENDLRKKGYDLIAENVFAHTKEEAINKTLKILDEGGQTSTG